MIWLTLTFACYNNVLQYQQVELEGTITSSHESGKVYMSAHHAWFGKAELRVPNVGFLTTEQDAPGDFTWTINVPVDDVAEGLSIYAWQDLDNDGVLCSLQGEQEYSDLIQVVAYPTFYAYLELQLENPCKAVTEVWDETP